MPPVPTLKVKWPSAKAFAFDVIAAALRLGFTLPSARLLAAHTALSTGWGRAASNYRLAGIKASESQPYNLLETTEYVNGVPMRLMQKFRAYASLEEGLRGLIGVLERTRLPSSKGGGYRYTASLRYLRAGSAEYFAQLGRDGWYTAPIAETAAGCKARLAQIDEWLSTAGTAALVALGIVAAST